MKNKAKNKKITMEDLAGMVQRGFSESSKNMNERFDKVEGKLDQIEKDPIASHEKRIKRVEEFLIIR